jgi:hypothetical protein
LGPTQSPFQWIHGVVAPTGKLTTHLYLVPRLIVRGDIPPLHQDAFMARYLSTGYVSMAWYHFIKYEFIFMSG